MGIKKLPTVKSNQAEYAGLPADKKKLYPEYSAVRQETKDLQMAKANVARLLGYEEKEKEEKTIEQVYRIGIDHGYGNIRTAHHIFVL